MSTTERDRAVLPPHLQIELFRTIPPEDPRIVPQNRLSVNLATQELYVYGNETLEPNARTQKMKKGRVAIMKVMVDTHTVGLVADLRYVQDPALFDETAPDEPPDDQEEFNAWQEFKKHETPIRAIAFLEEDGKTVGTLGDKAFLEAALTLTRIIDDLQSKRTAGEAQRALDEKKSENTEKPSFRERITSILLRPM